MNWIQTHTGRAFPINPFDPDTIHIDDIAHALSHVNRYNGHTPVPYSVAQHSVLVARRVRDLGGSYVTQLAALLHDASEAYLGDMVKPLKDLIPAFRTLEEELQALIYRKFLPVGSHADHALITRADLEMLATEAAHFFPAEKRPRDWALPYPAFPMTGLDWMWWPNDARAAFMITFDHLRWRA